MAVLKVTVQSQKWTPTCISASRVGTKRCI